MIFHTPHQNKVTEPAKTQHRKQHWLYVRKWKGIFIILLFGYDWRIISKATVAWKLLSLCFYFIFSFYFFISFIVKPFKIYDYSEKGGLFWGRISENCQMLKNFWNVRNFSFFQKGIKWIFNFFRHIWGYLCAFWMVKFLEGNTDEFWLVLGVIWRISSVLCGVLSNFWLVLRIIQHLNRVFIMKITVTFILIKFKEIYYV